VIRVLLVDDEELVRAGVRAVLLASHQVDVVAEAGDGPTAIDLALRHRPDVALVDLAMPDIDGLQVLADLNRLVPETRVVLLTSFGDEPAVLGAIEGKATGFVLKSGRPDELLIAVRAANRGEAYLSPPVTRMLLNRVGKNTTARRQQALAAVDRLSPRERQVADLIAQGLTNAEICTASGLTDTSTKTYVSRVMAKLGCTNRVQVALTVRDATDS
jgi:DNA-binding NarL/FixJ family response regulator